jgi:hypothetical protein
MTTPQGHDGDRLDRIERIVEGIAADVSEMKVEFTSMKDHMVVMDNRLAVLENDMAVMKGWQTELAVERRAGRVFARLCDGELLRIYPDSELRYYVSQSRRPGSVSREEAARAESVDFLLEGADANGAPVMFAVEVSYTGGIDDSDRAIEKAALLTRLLGRDVKSAVVGESFTAQFEEDASRRNVAYARIRDGGSVKR